jgi:hypothetical protein
MKKSYLSGVMVILLLFNIGFVCGDVLINEVMYNPTTEQGGDGNVEWVELYNDGLTTVNLADWTIDGNDFDDYNITAGEYLIVVDKVTGENSFEAWWGNNDLVWNSTDGDYSVIEGSLSLNDNEDTFNLTDGTYSDVVHYLDDWGADDNGKTLERYNLVSNDWGESLDVNGTPGEQNSIYNSPPEIILFDVTFDEDSYDATINLTQQVTDEEDDPADISWDYIPADDLTVEILPNKILNISADTNFYGERSLTLMATDTGGLEDSVNITVTVNAVNDLPVIDPIDPIVFDEEKDNNDVDLDLYVSDIETADENLSWGYSGDTENLIIDIDEETHLLNISADEDWYGDRTITLTATDEDEGSSSVDVDISVKNVNDAPYFTTSPTDLTAIEAVEYTYDADADDIDSDVDELEFSIKPLDGAGIDDETGEFTWVPTPLQAENSLNKVEISVSDGEKSATQEFNVTVLFVLDIINIKINGESLENFETMEGIAPGDILNIGFDVINRFPTGYDKAIVGIDVTATMSPFGELEEKPEFYLDGQDTKHISYEYQVPYTFDDPDFSLMLEVEGEDLYENPHKGAKKIYFGVDRDFHRVKITGKEWSPDNLTCSRETSLTVSLANTGDYDEEGTITVYNAKTGTDMEQEFDLETAEEGDFVFNDIDASVATNDEEFEITVKYRDNYYVIDDSIDLTINDCFDVDGLEDVAKMDEDSDSDWTIDLRNYTYDIGVEYYVESTNTSILVCKVDSDGANLKCDEPLENWNGVLPINLTITKSGAVTKEQFDVTVNPVNDEPVASDVSAEVDEDSSVVIELDCSDIDEDSLSYIVVDGPGEGTLSGSGSSRTYRPDDDYHGSDSFTYKCNDGINDSNEATVDITVKDVLDEPSISDFSPKEDNLLIGDGVTQLFSITIDDPDNIDPVIKWYIGDTPQTYEGDKFPFEVYSSGIYEVTAKVTDSSETEDYGEKTWNIRVTEIPVTDDYTGTIANVPEDEVSDYAYLTIVKSGVAMIDFTGVGIDLREVIDVDANVRIQKGVAGINSNADGFAVFKNKQATITMYGLSGPSAPTIYYHYGFETTGTKICDEDSHPSCTNIDYNAGTLEFDVSHFTMFFLNMPPTITSSAVTTAVQGDEYRYDVQATDPESDTLTYSLTQKPSGMNIDGSTGLITWTPSNITEEDVTVRVTDGTNAVTQSFKIRVEEPNRLRISDLDVKVEGENAKDLQNGEKIKEEARPGDKVKFDIEIENMFSSASDMMIEDITVEVIIRDVDDGDDLEEDVDIDEIDAGDDDSVALEFEIPTLVDEGDYDVLIDIDGEDEDGNEHDVRWELTLEVKKNKHDLLIDDVDLIPSTVKCNRNPALDVEVINIGREDEDDVTVKITNTKLGIDLKRELGELEEGDDEDTTDRATFRFVVDDDAKEGTYPIEIKAAYDGKTGDEATVDLIVEECIDITTPLEGDLVDVVIEEPEIKEPVTPVTEISFRESSEYMTLLIILFVILAGGVIFLIGGTIILMKKKR